ncbi:CRISPR-associated protein, Csm2 family [Planktothrix sp. PCC 11201]|uniref:type III-A CRISPR-associated protein Csm2 n=1 Tax=Planktothrix sp. PCC 11201 TaxID=1729650 RepID=UPI00091B77F8|nr:type III-A CRISPR-associated protein Csm2 [Planktothrix sp. PCC 11201]SKB15255.1 CRISPR-associated protein, Csm2 family [Planktothrix sp. PCC 11201]
MPIDKDIEDYIKSLKFLKDYSIRDLVKHAQEFGPYLKEQRLETNQVRKFLDAINRLKVKITQNADQSDQNTEEKNKKVLSKEESNKKVFSKIEPEVVLLKPKLAYAAARQPAAKPLSKVISVAIDKVHSIEDFERLVQFIESTIAYHKAEGGK